MLLEVSGLRKSFGGAVAVDDVSFAIAVGGVAGLIGPNGAGKTTVFNLVSGLVRPDAGEVRFQGKPLRDRPHRIVGLGVARTFQELRLFGSISALDNVMLAMQGQPGESVLHLFGRWQGCNADQQRRRERALELLQFVGLAHVADAAASDLSYGQQKRVALARVLAAEPSLVCLDEPAAGLDPAAVEGMVQLLQRLVQSGKTLLLVEHNLDIVRQVCDRVLFMDQGKLVVEGDAATVLDDPRVFRGFMGV